MNTGSASKLPTILITVLITAVVIIAGMYALGFVTSSSSDEVVVESISPTPLVSAGPSSKTPSISPVDTTGWKTYTNMKYGFELKYPSNLQYRENDKGALSLAIETREGFEVLSREYEATEGPPVFFQFNAGPMGTEFIFNPCDSSDVPRTLMTIDNVRAQRCEAFGLYSTLGIKFTKGEVVYKIVSDEYDGETKNIIDTILSTFRFTK